MRTGCSRGQGYSIAQSALSATKAPVLPEDIRWVAPVLSPVDELLELTLIPLAWMTPGQSLLDASGGRWHETLPFAHKVILGAQNLSEVGSQPRLRPVELESFETRERFDLIIAAVAGPEDWSGVLASLSRLLREGATDAYGVVVMPCAEGASPVDEALASARLHLVDDLRFASPASSGEAPTAARLWGDSVFEEDLGFRLPRHHGDGCGRALILSRAAPPLAGSPPRLATREVRKCRAGPPRW